jgi:hypothetical protein
MKFIMLGVVIALCAAGAFTGTSSASAPVVCAYSEGPFAVSGSTVTAKFHVVQNNCQVSLVGISYFGGPTTIVDTATGTFSIGFYELTVRLPCGTNTEADLVLGPPVAFPPLQYDMRNQQFFFPCATVQTRTQGYWKNHAEAWPLQVITVGGTAYTKSQAIALLQTPPAGGIANLILAHQLIAAMLNIAAGTTSSCITSTISAANSWLAANGGAAGSVKASTPAGQVAVGLATTLDQYNNGKLCAAGG